MIRSLSFVLLANALGQIAAIECPELGETANVSSGSISIANFAKGLCTLTTVSELGDLLAIARSYDGKDWEPSPGPFVDSLSINCGNDHACTLNLSDIDTPMKLTSYAPYLKGDSASDQKKMVAKFLEQATFGPTREDINEWDYSDFEGSFKNWVSDQINSVPLSSHREFYRERTNPRMDQVYFSARASTTPCEKNARFRNFAFTSNDMVRDKKFSVKSIGDGTSGPFVAMIDGFARTVISSLETEDDNVALAPNQEYDLCHPRNEFWKEGAGQPFKIRVGSACLSLKGGNPKVDISEIVANNAENEFYLKIIDMSKASFVGIDDEEHETKYFPNAKKGDEFILNAPFSSAECEALPKPYSADGKPLAPIFAKRFVNGVFEYMIFDPRLQLLENTVDKPMADGGGQAVLDTDGTMRCSNVPRSFLNEDQCYLSYSESACSPESPAINTIALDKAFLEEIDDMTGSHLYAFTGLPLKDDSYIDSRGRTQYYLRWSTCRRNIYSWSRFQSVDPGLCEGDYRTVTAKTEELYQLLLSPEWEDPHNPNPTFRDVLRRRKNNCDSADYHLWDLGYIKQNQTCWKHVHPMEGNIYDMTKWYEQPDLMSTEFAELGGWIDIAGWAGNSTGSAVLTVPEEHGNKWFFEVLEWNKRKHFGRYQIGRMDDRIPFRNLPNHLETPEVEKRFAEFSVNNAGKGVVICGSVGEVANKPELGDGFQFSSRWGFDDRVDASTLMGKQKHTVWTLLALYAKDQLRQRVAFALSQILVIAPSALGDHTNTEASLAYYDIFTRNAFGSYRDILKEVSFSEKMSRMLSSVRNRSYQYNAMRNRPAFPDENFAREVMQLFSIGLYRLNMDGTPVLDSDGNMIENYGSDDLLSYSRAWTGLEWPQYRANTDAISSRVDPMRVVAEWHDYFPKSDLLGGYIGDRNYPLCIDMPDKHFAKKGATYRLLGSRNRPELQEEPYTWQDEPLIKRLTLSESSPLYAKLCASETNGGPCTFPGKVVLDEDLEYTDDSHSELRVNSIRSVKVQGGEIPIYYEYVRQPCVEQTFYHNAKKVEDYTRGRRWNTNQYTAQSSMCADPRRDVASESCCTPGWEDSTRPWYYSNHGYKFCEYNGERLTWNDANQRCVDNGKEACTTLLWHINIGGYCVLDIHRREAFYSWTQRDCKLEIKLSDQSEIAVVHRVEHDYSGQNRTWAGVDEDTINFFKPAWSNKVPPGTDCSSISGCYEEDEGCFCEVNLVEAAAFTATPPSLDKILEKCFIGAPDPESLGGAYSIFDSSIDGVTVYSKDSSWSSDNIFEFVDDLGKKRFLKNLVSDVSIGSSDYGFRNPVQFINLADPELLQVYDEMDAVLDSYFEHPSHPPFLAYNMIQRFGISNPSPRFVEEVANAYKSGSYEGIGSGNYGDMGALVAAILLGSESRSISVVSDPTYGQLREPLIKVISLMRAMEYKHDSPLSVPLLDNLLTFIGQGSHQHPSVFSFFLSEFQPDGPVGNAGLVSPESQVLAGKKVTDGLEGLLKLVKNGLDPCDGGFQWYRPIHDWREACSRTDGEVDKNYGYFHYTHDSGKLEDVLDELSTLLTAGRLSESNTELVRIAAEDQFTYGQRARAFRAMVELIIASPEFQTNGLTRNSNEIRKPPVDDEKAKHEYKAIVFLMFHGGMDSWNMLIPVCGDLYQQYSEVRGVQLRLAGWETNKIKTTGQPCEDFGINRQFRAAFDMYQSGEALFYANMGVLRAPVDRFNYTSTGSRLFAHNIQQKETQKVDINKQFRNTGVGGRILDYLKKNGYKTSANSINGGDDQLVRGSPKENNPVRLLSTGWPRTFNRYATMSTITERIKQLNGETNAAENGLFGETWSFRLNQAFDENEESIALAHNKSFAVNTFTRFRRWETGLERQFRAVATSMKSREFRNVDREVYYCVDGGYDMHHGDHLDNKLMYVSQALAQFKDELKRQGIWENVVIVSGSDFGRTLVPNSNGGTDHAWGGHYFMMGGSLNGGKILGKYPEDIREGAPYRIGRRGRVVPETSYTSMWNGIAQWMGVPEEELDDLLPNRKNFDKCVLQTDKDLFKDGSTDPYCPSNIFG